jgi:hypothetical protein
VNAGIHGFIGFSGYPLSRVRQQKWFFSILLGRFSTAIPSSIEIEQVLEIAVIQHLIE